MTHFAQQNIYAALDAPEDKSGGKGSWRSLPPGQKKSTGGAGGGKANKPGGSGKPASSKKKAPESGKNKAKDKAAAAPAGAAAVPKPAAAAVAPPAPAQSGAGAALLPTPSPAPHVSPRSTTTAAAATPTTAAAPRATSAPPPGLGAPFRHHAPTAAAAVSGGAGAGGGHHVDRPLSLEEQQVLAFVRRHHVDVATLEGLYTARPAYLKLRARSSAVRRVAGPLRCQLSTMLAFVDEVSGQQHHQQCKIGFLRNLSSIEERAEQKLSGESAAAATSHDCLVSSLIRQNRDRTEDDAFETNYEFEVELAVPLHQGSLSPRLRQQLAQAKAESGGKLWQKVEVEGYTLRYVTGEERGRSYDVLAFERLEAGVKYSVDLHLAPDGGAQTYELEALGAQAARRFDELRAHYRAFQEAATLYDFHDRLWRYADFVEFCSHRLVEAIWPSGSSRFDCFVV